MSENSKSSPQPINTDNNKDDMISLSVVKVKFRDKKFMMTRAALDHIRGLLTSVRGASDKDAQTQLDGILAAKHELPAPPTPRPPTP